jgi:hypothetical protein
MKNWITYSLTIFAAVAGVIGACLLFLDALLPKKQPDPPK